MTDIFDDFEPMSFGGLKFPYTTISIRGGLRTHQHVYLHRPGAELESLGRMPYEVRVTSEFHNTSRSWPDLYPSRLAALISMCETEETRDLFVPNLGGALKCKATEWPRELSAQRRSGETVNLTFVEDLGEKYTTINLIGVASKAAPALLSTLQGQAERIGDPVVTTRVNALANVLAEFSRYRTIAIEASYLPGPIDAIVGASQLLAQSPALQLAQNATMLGTTRTLWATFVKIRNQGLEDATRPLLGFVTPRDGMSVVDVSLKLYGSSRHAVEIMQINPIYNPMSIKVGTLLKYLAPPT